MQFCAEVPYYEWFKRQPVTEEVVLRNDRFESLLWSVKLLLQNEEPIFIIGEEAYRDGKPEPLYLVKLPKEIRVVVFFGFSEIVISVASPHPLAVNWLKMFDVDDSCGRKGLLFSPKSYAKDHRDFSLRLKDTEQLYAFFLLLMNAK